MDSCKGKTVLCVEDEEPQLLCRKKLLESAGFTVLEARSAASALETFRSSRVDAVVMDYWLSGSFDRNGTALAQEMKRLRPQTPIVMLSGLGCLPGETTIVDLWLSKVHVQPGELLDKIQRLLALRNPKEVNKQE